MSKARGVNSDDIFRRALELRGQGQPVKARKLLLDAAGAPDASTELFQLLGVICGELGQAEDAARHLRRAVELAPKSVSAHLNLGNILMTSAHYEQALASFTAALALRPKTAEFLSAAGDALAKLGCDDEAIGHYRQAIAVAPNQPHAHENLGRVLYKLDRFKEAAKSLQTAVRLVPDNVEAIVLLGKALFFIDLVAPALEAFTYALKLMPDHAAALALLIYCKQIRADWTDYEPQKKQLLRHVSENASLTPFILLLIADEPEIHLAGARKQSHHEPSKTAAEFPAPVLLQDKRLRLAYISADYKKHPISYLMASFFAHHDRQKFEITGVSLGTDDGSAIRERVIAGFDRFVEARDMSARAISEKLRSMGADIAVDLMGHTNGCRPEIFHHRAAPIQVAFLGYPGTTGADCMDYIILDPFIATRRVRENLSEKPVILPDCYLVNDRLRPCPETALSRSDYGLPDDGFIFCAFNNSLKITPDVFSVWMRILKNVDGSVLWLRRADPVLIANLRKEAAARGVSPDRLIFAATTAALEDHLARYRVADLFLDTLPYGGHTTASDALWMDCPVITCAGESFAARVAGSLLHTIGLPELVTDNLQDYESLAIGLAGNPARLAEIRAKLAARRLTTPLFDTALFTRNIETAYQEMWRLHQSGQPPRDIDLSGGLRA